MIPQDVKITLDKKISLLQEYLSDLEAYLRLENDQIINNKDKLYAMERVFQLVVDETVDINAILAYHLGGKIPDSFSSSFYEIVPLKIIDHDFAIQIAESAKIRNQITHEYERLSDIEVVISTRKFFEMYKIYAKILIQRFIDSPVEPPK